MSPGPVAGRSGSAAALAGDLQAARNSLQRNDLASAQAQLDAARAAHRDDDQVLALQREVEARAESVRHAPGEKLAQGSKSPRSSMASSGKGGRAHESYVARREHSNRASGEAKTRRGTEMAAAAVGAVSPSQGRASGAGAPVVAGSSSAGLAELKVVSNVTSVAAATQATQAQALQPVQPARPTSTLPPGSQAELAAQAASVPSPSSSPSSSSPQIVSSAGTQLKSEGGPKTRAQVRAEIARARADGSLPAFGNPDPAGPGGAPSLTTAPRP